MYRKNSNVAEPNEDKLLPISQSTQVEAEPKYRCDLCGKECKSGGGRTLHLCVSFIKFSLKRKKQIQR